jgi:YkoY family integral membrane protein
MIPSSFLFFIEPDFLATVFSIAMLEILLSVDNALVNASLAEELPRPDQKKAIFIGIGLGALFRILCLFIASFLIKSTLVKTLGALYLCYLAYEHFFRSKKEEKELKKHPHLKKVIIEIAIADLVFSIDNIVGAVGISSNFKLVVFGVLVGIVSMLFVTQLMSVLIHKFPTLERTAYLIVAFIGLAMLSEMYLALHIDEIHKFFVIFAMLVATIAFDMGRRTKK